jgi:hypothetical protein
MTAGQKKITALGFLLFLAIPLVFSIITLARQKITQFQREERFEKEMLQTISVATESIYWVEPGKEALINGRLFDVESYRTEGSNLSLTGFFDDEEEEIKKGYKTIVGKKNNNTAFDQFGFKFTFFPTYSGQSQIDCSSNWKLISNQYHPFTEPVRVIPATPIIQPPRFLGHFNT